MTEQLADWLLVQLAADEQVARADMSRYTYEVGLAFITDEATDGHLEAIRAHAALWDPARVLADIDAKRQLLDEHYEVHRDIGWLHDGDEASDELPVCGCCVPKHSHFRTRTDVPIYPCRTVRLLALPYAGRDGYQDSWRP